MAGLRHNLGRDHVTPSLQELLLILEEYWAAHPELHGVPIYYASPLAKRCMRAYQTYINSMNDKIRQQYDTKNPFVFKHILNLKGLAEFDDNGTLFVGGWVICNGRGMAARVFAHTPRAFLPPLSPLLMRSMRHGGNELFSPPLLCSDSSEVVCFGPELDVLTETCVSVCVCVCLRARRQGRAW